MALRSIYYEQLKTRTYPLIYQPDERVGYRYVPGIEGKICIPSICKEFSINQNGFYGPDFQRRKQPGVFRIAVVGASAASGIWLAAREDFSMKLQRLFDQAGMPVEVNNFSIDGRFRAVESLRLIQETVMDHDPDLVLLHTTLPFIYSNSRRAVYRGYMLVYRGDDPESLTSCQRRVDAILEHWFLIGAYRASFIVRAGVRFFQNHWQTKYHHEINCFIRKSYQDPAMKFLPYSVLRSGRELQEVRARLQARDSELLIFMYQPEEKLRRYLDHFGLPYIELSIGPPPAVVYRHDGHFNETGHRLIAEQLFAGLVERGSIPGSRQLESAEK